MNTQSVSWREDWAPTTATPANGSTFMQRYGRRKHRASAAKPPRLPTTLLRSAIETHLSDPSTLDAARIDPSVRLECPACTMRAQMDDFDLVSVGGTAHLHCPACDANLGLPERTFLHAA